MRGEERLLAPFPLAGAGSVSVSLIVEAISETMRGESDEAISEQQASRAEERRNYINLSPSSLVSSCLPTSLVFFLVTI